MRLAIQKAREADLLDCDDYSFDLEVVVGAGSYVCGEETALLESLEGRRGVVLAKPPYPAESGLYRQTDDRQQRPDVRDDSQHSGERRRLACLTRH